MSVLARFLRNFWRLLDGLRKVLHLLLLLVIFAILAGGLAHEKPFVPTAAALVIDPQGTLVDQLSGDPVERALARARGTASPETLVKDVVDAIRAGKDDKRIKTLVLQLDGMSDGGLSKLQEIGAAIRDFKTSGKRVFAIGDGYNRDQYYLAAQADEVYLHPMGDVLVDGYSRFLPYYKDALQKLYIDYNVWTVGEYKSFVEPITRNSMSDFDKEASRQYLNGLWQSYQADVTAARKLQADAMQRYADDAPELLRDAGGDAAKLALDYGLVDELLPHDLMRDRIREAVDAPGAVGGARGAGDRGNAALGGDANAPSDRAVSDDGSGAGDRTNNADDRAAGGGADSPRADDPRADAAIVDSGGADDDNEDEDFPAIEFESYLRVVRPAPPSPSAPGSKVAVVVLSGEILDGEQPSGTVGGDSSSRLIREAAEDDGVKALVLRVDSPGGSAFGADLILREVELFQQSGRPVVVSMGSVAASGGYWVSMSADEIIASPTTLTGSIGVGATLPTFQRTLARLGVNVDGIGTTDLSGQYDLTRSLGDNIKSLIGQQVENTYQQFIGKVAMYRGESIEDVDRVARGRVWTGSDALERGLVDRLGNLEDAIASAADMAGLEKGKYRVEYVEPRLTFTQRLAMQLVQSAAPLLEQLGNATRVPRSVSTLVDRVKQPLEMLARWNDPRHLYAYCFCDVR
ncbi:MAG TPA: signal peptide peptidase SppA [Gammaproteobacteria bacterium]|nr:signal peptide peptidase SppA [Gammaproteobacteria bacterium]